MLPCNQVSTTFGEANEIRNCLPYLLLPSEVWVLVRDVTSQWHFIIFRADFAPLLIGSDSSK